jgi:hypothetical protein
LARVVSGALPQVYQLYPPRELIHEVFPPPAHDGESGAEASEDAPT